MALGRRATAGHDSHLQLKDESPRLAAQESPLRAMGADDESATVLEQSRTRDEAEREIREGKECLSGPGDGHSTGKCRIYRKIKEA